MRRRSLFLFIPVFLFACQGGEPTELEAENTVTSFIEAGTPSEAAVLALVNDPKTTLEILDDDIRLDRRAAENIFEHRTGPDGYFGSGDDDLFDDIAELDAISYVGQSALLKLLEYAQKNGFWDDNGDDGELDPIAKAAAIIALVNSPTITFLLLDDDVGLDRRAAQNIWDFRAGIDGILGNDDDATFTDLAELDAISWVGERALADLLDYAVAHGFVPSPRHIVAVFSPQLYDLSHNARIAELIGRAEHSLDIAMYSFSDARISEALELAVQRGVSVRFIFESANKDRRATDTANTKSGRLEAIGINVRYVNKIMHHKFVIADGPRDDLSRAESCEIASGSGNWSWGAATIYDENTLFLTGYPEVALRLQNEFDRMWQHSRDFIHDANLPYELSTREALEIEDDPAVDVFFTSDNFSVSGDTFRIITGNDTVSDQLVLAIERATDSIHVASGHLRSRPVAEALEARALADPELDIRVYLDGQEYVSVWSHVEQLAAREQCLSEAGDSASKIRKCNDKGFRYGYHLGNVEGIDIRYKHYAYRWHYSYAAQMHHKFLIIDNAELWTGSYNLSDNAEHNTFENMMLFKGPEHAALIASYEETFEAMWELSRADGTYDALLAEVETAAIIPLVYTPMALDWAEVAQLKAALKANCADINSEAFRSEPATHRTCAR